VPGWVVNFGAESVKHMPRMEVKTSIQELGGAGKPGEPTAAAKQPAEIGAIDPKTLTPAGVSSLLERGTDTAATCQPLPKLAVGRREAAQTLSISPATLDRLVQRGLLRPSRATRRPLFSREELERFLRETTGSID
jgi:hypothetical protein